MKKKHVLLSGIIGGIVGSFLCMLAMFSHQNSVAFSQIDFQEAVEDVVETVTPTEIVSQPTPAVSSPAVSVECEGCEQ